MRHFLDRVTFNIFYFVYQPVNSFLMKEKIADKGSANHTGEISD